MARGNTTRPMVLRRSGRSLNIVRTTKRLDGDRQSSLVARGSRVKTLHICQYYCAALGVTNWKVSVAVVVNREL
jgi:hypothetical protein